MPILNGFLRGAHDEEITANIDQKQYQGVPVNTYNWIGTKRGGLSKRAPFKLQRTLDQESYIIPYSYDDDEKYLIEFFTNNAGDTYYRLLKYENGSLTNTNIGGLKYSQPVFSSNTSDDHIISSNTLGEETYKLFNTTVIKAYTDTIITIEFPQPVILQKISYVYGSRGLFITGGAFGTTIINITDENGVITQTDTIVNEVQPDFTQGTLSNSIFINNNGIAAKKLSITFKDRIFWNTQEKRFYIGDIELIGQMTTGQARIKSPISKVQIKSTNYYNAYRKMYFVNKDFAPYELVRLIEKGTYTGLDNVGNPTLVTMFQQRLVFGGFVNSEMLIKASESTKYNNFQLNLEETKPTDPLEGTISEIKSPITALFGGRQMLYAQSTEGLGSLNSGADNVPLTATQVEAKLRNITPLSRTLQPVRQDEIVYCFGADDKSVYALDYDYQYARMPLYLLNEHCMSYFDSGIKQVVSIKGKLPYLVFLLNDGSLIFAIAYRQDTGFQFHAFPQKTNGWIKNIASLRNTQTGYDTLFAVIQHTNGKYTLESIEEDNDFYTAEKSSEYFKNHVLLDMKKTISPEYDTNIKFKYNNKTVGGKKQFTTYNKFYAWKKVSSTGDVPDFLAAQDYVYTLTPTWITLLLKADGSEFAPRILTTPIGYATTFDGSTDTFYAGHNLVYITQGNKITYQRDESADIIQAIPESIKDGVKLLINNKEITCSDCVFDEENNMLAITSDTPDVDIVSTGYLLKKKTFSLPEYAGLEIQAFDGHQFIEKEREGTLGQITFKKAFFAAEIGLPYKSYSEFINLVDVNSAPYQTIINNISASITYGTGIKLGTESTLEKVGYSEYPYTQWQNSILPDESLKNVILNDIPKKNKRIVMECEFPFPANVTFITYDIKATGVK